MTIRMQDTGFLASAPEVRAARVASMQYVRYASKGSSGLTAANGNAKLVSIDRTIYLQLPLAHVLAASQRRCESAYASLMISMTRRASSMVPCVDGRFSLMEAKNSSISMSQDSSRSK